MKKIPVSVLVLLLLLCSKSYAQSAENQQKAVELMKEAVRIMDEGQLDSSIVLLRHAEALDPANRDIPYELAYAYFQSGHSDSTVVLMTKLLKRIEHPQIYELLGNAYDVLKQSDKAIEAYDKGLKMDPQNSHLLLNKGVLYVNQQKGNEAMECFEKGIDADPGFPSNYFWASQLLAENQQYIWALLYGENFLINEPGSKRSGKISEMLYNIYKNQITFTDTAILVKLNKVISINAADLMDSKKPFKLPFVVKYEMAVSLGTVGSGQQKKEMSLALLSQIRSNFIKMYYSNKYNEEYPNILLEFQKQLDDAGLTEPYTYFLFRYGNLDEFRNWIKDGGEAKLKTMVAFLQANSLKTNQTNYVHRSMYQ